MKKMNLDELISKLLFVPFNDDYKVLPEIRKKLTNEEFFEKCFIKPAFDEEIEKALKNNGEEIDDFELDLTKEDLIKKLEKRKEKYGSLQSWIKSGQSDLYCIRGDAGTGKTTLLHYLKYECSNSNITWEIIDIQKATEEVSILRNRVIVPNFSTLYSKAISAIIYNIISSMFLKNSAGKMLFDETKCSICQTVQSFNDKFDGYYPRDEVVTFFELLIPNESIISSSREFCEHSANNIQIWISQLLNNKSITDNTKFTIFLEILVYYLVCSNTLTRHMIAFDNFERFIGTDEIYDGQLTEFVSSLRGIQQSIVSSNEHLENVYQIIIFMRNTSVRMFTSQQVTEFFPHDIDLSDWFDVSSVVKKKIEWYKENGIVVDEANKILNIFNDMGECGETLRGLHFKISMLFNYNKRIVIEFLARILLYSANQQYIELYETFWDNKNCVNPTLNKFAARSIIYRLTLNALREDGFFVNIVAQCPKDCNNDDEDFNSLGCARKILTILYDHDITCAHNADSRYLSLDQLVNKMFVSSENSLKLLFDETNDEKLNTIVQVLFYMNYYNARKYNWLQFIDLQYNSCDQINITISDPQSLKEYIKSNAQNIKMRITNAGKAYLYFVVYYFEYFSCKSLGKTYQKEKFDNKDMPPLLCCIPTKGDIEDKNISSLACIRVIDVVLREALSCISTLNNSEKQIMFRSDVCGKYISHQQRIVNSHRGFLDNFVEYIKQLYAEQYQNGSDLFREKFDKLIKTIIDMRNKYIANYTEKVGD